MTPQPPVPGSPGAVASTQVNTSPGLGANNGFTLGGKAKPVVSDSTGLTLNPESGAPVARVAPVEIPKNVKWQDPVTAVKAASGAIPKGQGVKAVVSYVGDGDTFKTQNGVICRIDTIDAPETAKPQYGKQGQPFGEESKKRLEQMILNKEVNVRIVKPDGNYKDRAICQVEIEGKGLDQAMVEQGAAWVYERFAKDTLRGASLKQAQQTAKEKRVGLWKDPNPIYPPTFRQQQR